MDVAEQLHCHQIGLNVSDKFPATPWIPFSPSISDTVARHMHVRANLSGADYKALLRFS